MTRMPPAPERTDPAYAAGEFETLLGYLDYHRDTLLTKVADLKDAGLRRSCPPSSLTLAALVHHLAYVEDWWVIQVLCDRPAPEPWASAGWADDEDWEMTTARSMTGADLLAQFAASRARCDAALNELAGSSEGIDTLSLREDDRHEGRRFSVRWVLVHLIEEYARHNGHADFIRESIDGVTGE